MKNKFHPSFVLSSITLALFTSPYALGQNSHWDSNGDTAGAGATPGGTWGVDPFWNTTGAGNDTMPTNATTTRSNDLFFSAGSDAVNAYTVTVDGTQNAKAIFFQDGQPTLSGGSIVLAPVGGLTVNSTAAVAGATVTSNLSISGRTLFAIGSTGGARTLNLNTGTFTRTPGAVLLVTSGGILTSTMSGLSANANGIVGPWATFSMNSGETTPQHAAFDGNDIVGFTGTAAVTAADVTDTGGTFNYDVAAVGTMGTNASVNTLRYTGAAGGNINTSGTFSLNGILHTPANALTVAGDLTIGSANELVVNNISTTGPVTLSGNIGDNGANASALSKAGAGTLFLGGNNTYSGDTMIVGSAGGIVVTANNALGTTDGTTTVMPYKVTGNSLGFSGGIDYSTAETIIGSGVGSSPVSGSFPATQRGFAQSVSGNNTFAGAIEIHAGRVSRIGTQDGAQLTLSGPITMAAGTTGVTVLFRAGNTDGDYITLNSSSNSWDVQTLIYSGNTGTGAGVRLGVDNALPTAVPVGAFDTANTGTTLDLAGFNQEVNGLILTNGSTNLKITNSAAATTSVLTLNTTANRTFNAGGLVQDGAGVIRVVNPGSAIQTMQGAHTYTGTTTVDAGTLRVNGSLDAASMVIVNGGDLGGTGTIGGSVTVAAAGNLAPGASAGTLTINGDLDISAMAGGAGTLDFELDALASTNDLLAVGGSLALGSLALDDFNRHQSRRA